MQFSEVDIIRKLILPALQNNGWTEDQIRMESSIDAKGSNRTYMVDIVLQIRVNTDEQPIPIAVLEAKRPVKSILDSVPQAIKYAKVANVPFAIVTDGHDFIIVNRLIDNQLSEKSIDKFPSPDELRQAYEQQTGIELNSQSSFPLRVPYAGGEQAPRPHQDAAIRAVIEAYLSGKKRIAVNMAQGSGKTFTIANLIRRLIDSGKIRRVLYLVDRQDLAHQTYQFLSDIMDVKLAHSSKEMMQMQGRVIISTIQKLFLIDADEFIQEFDLVISSDIRAEFDARITQILQYSTLLVGFYSLRSMIPERIFASSAYEYTFEQAIGDGYLTRIAENSNFDVANTENWIPVNNPLDVVTSEPISDEELLDRYSVFISYRRDDSATTVRNMFDFLSKDIELQNDHQIFMDKASIRYGDDFVDSIMTAIDSSSVVVVVIGRQWVNITDIDGNRRLDNPNDYVRREVESAIEGDKIVLPVLVNNASMPGANLLPESMITLSRLHAFEIVHKEEYFDQEMAQLTDVLKDLLKRAASRND